MSVEIQIANDSDKEKLWRLMQLYQYDFSEIPGPDLYREIDANGYFRYDDFNEYWQSSSRYPFFILLDTKLVGFAFIRKHHPAIQKLGISECWAIAEFFIMRRYRRKHVGEKAAHAFFSLFPGLWAVAEIAENTPAHKFWRTIIHRYTHGNYQEYWINQENWEGPVQVFDSSVITENNEGIQKERNI